MYAYQERCFLNEKVYVLFYYIMFYLYSVWTTLSVVHMHYLILGLVEMNVHFVDEKVKKYLILYHVGLNMTAMMLVVREIVQVTDMHVVSAAISGIAGIGHILLGVSLILILIQIKHAGKDEAPCFF